MNMRLTTTAALVAGLLMAPLARAEPPLPVQIEANFLLGYLEGSACQFYRNGTWYDSKAAQAHLRVKYKYLAQRNQINTTEEFIEKAASESSLSGKPYQVKCNDGVAVSSSQWLHDELARFRTY